MFSVFNFIVKMKHFSITRLQLHWVTAMVTCQKKAWRCLPHLKMANANWTYGGTEEWQTATKLKH